MESVDSEAFKIRDASSYDAVTDQSDYLTERLSHILASLQHLFCQNRKAAQLLRRSPNASLEEGLRQTIDWYREHDVVFEIVTLAGGIKETTNAAPLF
jgi:dTDP-D-glucose 4,6-dehydratase